MSGDESDSSSCSGGSLVSSSSSSSGDTDIIIAACLQQRVRKLCRIRRITMLKIRARVVTVDRPDDDWAWRCSVILYIHAPVHIYGVTYYSTTTTSDVVVAYNTSEPWNLMLSGHANY